MQYIVTAPDSLTQPLCIGLPASKSLSNRALIMQGLCRDYCRLTNISDCDDTRVMLAAFDPESSHHSYNPDGARIVDIGAAGTSMRFLTAFFASQEGSDVVMTGSARMKQRPIALLVDALRQLGARIDYVGAEGFPPLRISGRQLKGGALTIDGSISSQYISALLMIAPTLSEGLRLKLEGNVTSTPYIEMTLGMLRQFGITSEWDHSAQVISIAPQPYKALQYHVESDWSAASYWYEIAALAARVGKPESIALEGLHTASLQGDAAIASHFEAIGVKTVFQGETVTLNAQGVTTEDTPLVELDLSAQPDLAQTLIVTCCALNLPFRITGLHTLRIKETDRVAALETELKKLGYVITDQAINGSVEMQWDGTRCEAEANPVISTYKDHRMAMAFAPMVLVIPSRSILIDDPGVVSKSYPSYWEDLQKAGFSIKEL